MANWIQVGDEIRTRWANDPQVVGVVTYNTPTDFSIITDTGLAYHTTRAFMNPIKTGRHFDVESFLKTIRRK